MLEKIGNVTIDYEYYIGRDIYCDGDVEDLLLEAVSTHEPSDFQKVIEEKNNWPFLYHLSELRGNIVQWLPITRDMKVLEVGSGCGAITGTLAAKAGSVTCIDLSKKRSLINANRNKHFDNVTIKVGNFQDIEPHLGDDYDFICLIGVFEYAQAYIDSADPYGTFLNIIKSHLKKGGHIVIAIENRMGLKYLAGCQEDHLAHYFAGVEDYPQGGVVRTFTRPALEQICKRCQVDEYSFYYPYPDYKFMHTLFSDRRLPMKGELSTNLRNFDRDRLLLFDEKLAFDSIIDDGEFPYFSNSYMLVIGSDFDITYTKYSNDRSSEYAIRTDIVDADKKLAIKYGLTREAVSHLAAIEDAYKLLVDKYEDTDLYVCPLEKVGDGLAFPFLEGNTLDNELDRCLMNKDMDEFYALLDRFYGLACHNQDMELADFDFIFGNILIEGTQWKLIDYEWTVHESISGIDALRRGLFCYKLGGGKRCELDMQVVLRRVSKDAEAVWDEDKLWDNELSFQSKVTGGYKSLSQMRDSIHNEVLPLADSIARYKEAEFKASVQIYVDKGHGFSEADSVFVKPIVDNAENMLEYDISEGTKKLRIDPCMEPCIVHIRAIELDGMTYPAKKLVSNGTAVSRDCFAFSDNDPNVTIDLKKYAGARKLVIKYELTAISSTMAMAMK